MRVIGLLYIETKPERLAYTCDTSLQYQTRVRHSVEPDIGCTVFASEQCTRLTPYAAIIYSHSINRLRARAI